MASWWTRARCCRIGTGSDTLFTGLLSVAYPLLFLLAEDQLQRGDVGCALAFMLAFTGLLRISEVAGLRVGDVVFPEDPRFWGVAHVVLALAHTKTGDDLSAEIRASWL